ncbi:hypothetical protein [Maribacter hydrothermalis]|uniref:Uncharacterized protein n=1 Tax=Maribacter hydrothermalis TaxID=1836467 RepID=A0A1B7Z618_9FLAO|nr:hypothetical protein [Maribacter hydrothermalis]APQ18758.1 hypothetical protein BTR34_16170 [Maribacter hydrothermalis]OBR38159.1 hypothetical protein A9200_18110 [Maribacter hydrothermalis]
MNIFKRKTKKKHIEQFGLKVAELLETVMPQIKTAIELSKIYGISFMHKPNGIYISRGYNPKQFEIIHRNHKTCFNLIGISVWNKKENIYQPIKLYYQSDGLTKIEIDNPEYFHITFNLDKIQKGKIELEHLEIENPDQKTAEKILKSLTKEQIELLELDYTFEIEFQENLYYTILDMEDGNYIAIDKKGKVYRLNHDHERMVKLIANNPNDFFKIYKGQKSELENIMYE